MRPLPLAVLGLAACSSNITMGCFEPDLTLWCAHNNPQAELPCATPEQPEDAIACGDVMLDWSGTGRGLSVHGFRDGEHVTAQYGTDINVYCGGYLFTYGEPFPDNECFINGETAP